jgi:3-oxoacyl-[acyl-carrier protein] reductase
MQLKDAVAIVTGSATGLGAAAAEILAGKGCHVVINYTKSEKEARETEARCRAKGVKTLVVKANVAADEDCRRIVAQTVEHFGKLSALINNAGTTKFVDHADLNGLSAADFQAIYAVNVIGAFQMTRAAAPHLKNAGRAAVVNISSIAGVMGVGSSIAYAASKGALNTMTLSLARVLGPEVSVNTVCPGFIESRWLFEGYGPERYTQLKQRYIDSTPLKKAATAEEIAAAAVWMLEGSDVITGETLIVDSGAHLGGAPLRAR